MSSLLTLGVILSATDSLSPVLKSATGNMDTLDNKIGSVSANITKIGTASLALGTALTLPLKAALGDYQELSKAQGELATLGIGDSGLDAITKSAQEFTNEFAGTTAPQFVAAAYDIKSGISSLSDGAVGDFTKMAAMTASATKSSTGQMTSLFATGYGIYKEQFNSFGATTIEGWNKLSQEEKDIKFGEYFSSGISSSVQAFKTDGAQMSAALSNLGSNATSAGVSFAEQLNILGMLQKTISGSEAATKYRSFLNTAYGAGDKLGLSFTDANNQLLSMPEIITQIKDKYGQTIDAIESDELKKAFGTDEAVSMIKQLYTQTDELSKGIIKTNKSLQGGLELTSKMANAANKGKEFELLNQQINNATTLIGEGFAPVALELSAVIGETVQSVSAWMIENKELTSTIATTVAVAGGVLTVFGSIAVVTGAVGMALPFLSSGLGVATGAFGLLGTVVKGVSTLMMANPILAGVTAIATAGYLIYDNWDSIFTWFDNKLSSVSDTVSSITSFFGFGDSDVNVKSRKEVSSIQKLESEVKSTGVSASNSMINQHRNRTSSKVIHSSPTYQVTVTHPNSDVDVIRAIKAHDRNLKNRMYEDD